MGSMCEQRCRNRNRDPRSARGSTRGLCPERSREGTLRRTARPGHSWQIVAILCSAGACGGTAGGGSSAPDAAVNPPPAAIVDNVAAEPFSRDTLLAVSMAMSTQVANGLSIQRTGSTVTATRPGCRAGTASFSLTIDTSNQISGTGAYNNFDNCFGLTVNGSVTVKGSLMEGLNELLLTASDLLYTTSGQPQTYRFAGDIALSSGTRTDVRLNHSMRSHGTVASLNGDVLFSLEDLPVNAEASGSVAGEIDIGFEGRLVDPALGFVDVVSPDPALAFETKGGIVHAQFIMIAGNAQASYNDSATPRIAISPLPPTQLDTS